MIHTSIFNIAELLEQVLYFLAINKSLYLILFVSQLWYRCGASILWKRVELMGDEMKKWSRLENFLKIVYGGEQKLIYSLELTHLKILYYYPLSNKKIKDIIYTFSNIIHLSFEKNIDFTGKALKLIAKSYLNLKYLNIFALHKGFKSENDIGLSIIANSYHSLKYY